MKRAPTQHGEKAEPGQRKQAALQRQESREAVGERYSLGGARGALKRRDDRIGEEGAGRAVPSEIDEKGERRDPDAEGVGERRPPAPPRAVGRADKDRQQRQGLEAGGLFDRARGADRQPRQEGATDERERRQRRQEGERGQRRERTSGVIADGDKGQDGIEDRREDADPRIAEAPGEKEQRGRRDRVAQHRNRSQRLEVGPKTASAVAIKANNPGGLTSKTLA